MFKDLFKKFDYFWFLFLLTIFVCFIYFLANPVIGIDDEYMYIYSRGITYLNENRLGKFIINFLFSYDFNPVANDVICLACMILSVLLTVFILNKYTKEFSKPQSLIFSIIAISFPFIAFNVIFLISSIDITLSYLLCCFASYLFLKYFLEDKKKIYLLYILLLLIFSISMYETGIFYFVIVTSFVIFYKSVFENYETKNIKSSLKKLLYVIAFCILSLLIYEIIFSAVISCIPKVVINRVGKYLYYDFSGFSEFFSSLITNIKYFIERYISNLQNNFGCKMVLFSCSILTLIGIYYSIKNKNVIIFLTNIIIILTPLTFFLLTGFYIMPYRTFISYGFVCGLTFSILYRLLKENYLLSKIFIFLCFYVVFHQAKEMNQIFFTENLKNDNDKFFANSIVYDLKKLDLYEKPIAFVGIKEDYDLPYKYNNIADEINLSIFNWDRYNSIKGEIYNCAGVEFMNLLGHKVNCWLEWSYPEPHSEEYFLDIFKQNVPNMGIYPQNGSIRDVGEFVIIKIGKSRFDYK